MTKNNKPQSFSLPNLKELESYCDLMNEKKITSLLVVADKDLNKKNKMKLKGIIHIHFLLQHGLK